MPFYPATTTSVCDDLYEIGVDTVYVPNNRVRGRFSRLIADIALYGPHLLTIEKCYEPARRVLCHFFLPPCGNVTVFQPPTTVCPKQCKLIGELCPTEWAKVVDLFSANHIALSESGLQLIDCNSPGKYLSPLPYCCSDIDVGLNISKLWLGI